MYSNFFYFICLISKFNKSTFILKIDFICFISYHYDEDCVWIGAMKIA